MVGWLAGWPVTESIKWWLECSQYFNGLVCVEYNLSLSLSVFFPFLFPTKPTMGVSYDGLDPLSKP
jgi:hypothetical protein